MKKRVSEKIGITVFCVLLISLLSISFVSASFLGDVGNFFNKILEGRITGNVVLNTATSSAPSSVNLNDKFQIKCDFGAVLPCIAPIHGGQGCSFVNFVGTTAIFSCTAGKAGMQNNSCNIFYYAKDSRCSTPQVISITSTNVIAPCTPKTCSQLGKNCGSVDNGCGTSISCGTCTSGQTCTNGVCINQATTCTDSDGGKDYYKKGIITWGGSTDSDICGKDTQLGNHPVTQNTLREIWCQDNRIYNELFECPEGCKDGVCVKESLPLDMDECLDNANNYWDQETNKCYSGYSNNIIKGLCSDPDSGKNIYQYAHTYGFRKFSSSDNPSRDLRIRTGGADSCGTEYYCDEEGFIQSVHLECPNGCKDGACINDSAKYIIPQDFGVLNYNGKNIFDSNGNSELNNIFEGLSVEEGETATYREFQVGVFKYSDTIKYKDIMSFVYSELSNYQLDFDPAGKEYEGFPNAQILFAQSKNSNIMTNYFIWTRNDILVMGMYSYNSDEVTSQEFDSFVGESYMSLLKAYLKKYPSELVIDTSQINKCTDAGYKCTSAIRGCGSYKKIDLSCGDAGVGVICCSNIPYCGDGVCFKHDTPGYGEDEYNCPQDCGSKCTDSDGGKNKYTLGKTCFGDSCKTDTCNKSLSRDIYVIENYCYNENNPSDMYMSCSNGCSDGACAKTIPVQNEICQGLINQIANPSDININNQKYEANGWNYNYSGTWWINNQEYKYNEYTASWNVYNSNNEGEDYAHENVNINARVEVFEDSNIDLTNWIKEKTSYQVCVVQSYWDQNDKENIFYICNWDVLRNKQDIDNYDYNSREIFWVNNNVIVQMSLYTGRSLTKDEVSKIAQKKVSDFLNDLKNNKNKYVGWENFDITYLARSFIDESLKMCGSRLTKPIREGTNETCYPSWTCKLEPVICPEYGYQKKICVDNSCNTEKREEQIYCSPGLCSGCYVPRWYGYDNGDNICIPYGTRLAALTSRGEKDTIPEGTDLSSDGKIEFSMNITSENSAHMIFTSASFESENYEVLFDENLYSGNSYTIDLTKYKGEKIQFTVTKIVPATGNEKGYVEIETRLNFNAYCNYDGTMQKQKTVDSNGGWASCQNNYECESNLCSSGECVEITKMIKDAKGFKSTIAKLFCKMVNLFNVQNYEQCVSDTLGIGLTPVPSSGGSGGGGGSTSSSSSSGA